MIYQRKQKRLAQGKKCTTTDTRYFQVAENLLYVELGIALGKPKQQICKTPIDSANNRCYIKNRNKKLPIQNAAPASYFFKEPRQLRFIYKNK